MAVGVVPVHGFEEKRRPASTTRSVARSDTECTASATMAPLRPMMPAANLNPVRIRFINRPIQVTRVPVSALISLVTIPPEVWTSGPKHIHDPGGCPRGGYSEGSATLPMNSTVPDRSSIIRNMKGLSRTKYSGGFSGMAVVAMMTPVAAAASVPVSSTFT